MRNHSTEPRISTNVAVKCRLPLRLRRKQSGMTTLGFLILATFMGLFGYATIRLTPIYLNYVKIASVIDGVLKEYDGQNPTRSAIKKSITRRFDVESISMITSRDIKITSSNGGFQIEAVYDHTAPFVGNISFSVHFDKKVLIRR